MRIRRRTRLRPPHPCGQAPRQAPAESRGFPARWALPFSAHEATGYPAAWSSAGAPSAAVQRRRTLIVHARRAPSPSAAPRSGRPWSSQGCAAASYPMRHFRAGGRTRRWPDQAPRRRARAPPVPLYRALAGSTNSAPVARLRSTSTARALAGSAPPVRPASGTVPQARTGAAADQRWFSRRCMRAVTGSPSTRSCAEKPIRRMPSCQCRSSRWHHAPIRFSHLANSSMSASRSAAMPATICWGRQPGRDRRPKRSTDHRVHLVEQLPAVVGAA